MLEHATPKILTPTELLARLKERIAPAADKFPIVLWPCKKYNNPLFVETGNVLFLSGENDELANILWLDGHSSRNDTVPVKDILSLWDPDGPRMELFPFNGTGFLTEAGMKWKQEHPEQ